MAAKTTLSVKRLKQKVNNKGVHAKSKASANKSSKNYVKRNVGQGI